MKKLLMFYLALTLLSSHDQLLASDLKASDKNAPAYEALIPINHMFKAKTTLSAKIPTKYKPITSFGAKLMEFIPFSEIESNWSEIITLDIQMGARRSAAETLKLYQSTMSAQTVSFKLLEENASTSVDYSMASFGAVYIDKGRTEVIFLRYFSGPADLCGIQYTKVLEAGDSPEKVLEKLKADVDNMAKVVRAE